MTLVEFLLARIADDETYARHHSEHWNNCLAPKGGECTCIATLGRRNRRRLAWCEAKRRIIAACEVGCECLAAGIEASAGGCVIDQVALRALALPYADHPDYDEGWRP